jgi:hypothetical protein
MCERPTNKISNKSTNANGRKATNPSIRRTTGRDHRAVVIRWTAAQVTPAELIAVKKYQL